MARIDSLYCPFAPSLHPDASAVHERSVLWAQALGLLPTEHHVRSAYHAKAAWLVARAYPTAGSRGLQLVADWVVLGCLLDDHIEKLESTSEVAAYLGYLVQLFRAGTRRAPADPFAAGILDLRQQLLALAPPSHVERFADRLAELFASNVAEARNRERRQIPGVAAYMELRQTTIGLEVMFSVAEVVDGFHLPDAFREHPALRRLAMRASNIVGWANDLFTYEKEIIQGEIHNLVLVFMNERRLTVAEAVAEAVALHDDEVRRFVQEVAQLPSFGADDAAVQRYVAMLRCWIRGHLDWAYETGRYRPFEEPAREPGARPAAAPAAA